MDVSDNRMAHALRQAGYRLTQPRLAILQVLQENDESLAPEDILAQAQALYPSLGLVTVYRTMELLSELSLVQRLHSEPRCTSYASSGADRHLIICQRCHRVVEFPCEGLQCLIEGVIERTGYTVSKHLVELVGLCPECQTASDASTEP